MSGGIPYWHVDAFSAQPFGGNPAAVMVLDDRLPDAVMQQIAAEF
ncbi:MAG: PhzF family phenazine biosynthesis protein, partial [Pseudomonadota bacterium]|nr:PhzF family phenazine biosynthesis protein [Pseudomonadota bacterium]